jgi:hypothetical protein
MPPKTPYQVYGTVKYSGTNQVVVGATVTVTDTTLNESTTGTTNSSGEYLVNLSDLDGTWSNGDGLSVTAALGNRSKTETTTISGGAKQVNLTMSITTYPDYTSLSPEQAVAFSAFDIMDVDKSFTYNSSKQVTKEVANYGKFTVTKYFTYNTDKTVANISIVIS